MFDLKKRSFLENELRDLKRIIRNNPDIIQHAFAYFLTHFRSKDCECRLAILLLCNEFFQRSHLFRVQLINNFQQVLLHMAEIDPIHYSLPPPKEIAKILKLETLKLLKMWHEKYREAYPRLDFAIDFLRSSKSLDLENVSAELQVERQRASEEERRKEEKSKQVMEKIEKDFRERQNDIIQCINETRQSIELLVPRFDVGNRTDTDSSLLSRNKVHAYNAHESVTVTLTLNAPVVNVSVENEAVINSLLDCMKMLQFYHRNIHYWLCKLTKYCGNNAQNLCCEIVDLKSRIAFELKRCEELKLSGKKKHVNNDSDSDDFEDVPEKEGLELNFKPPEDVPDYILRKTMDKTKDDGSSSSGIVKIKNQISEQEFLAPKEAGNNTRDIPILSYGLDLKYWGEDDVQPAEIPRNNSDCHRFWRPSDESCVTNCDSIEAYHARVITFAGHHQKNSRQCRAPLRDGTLCPRMDSKRCPLHGKIIDRDEMGYPVDQILEKPDVSLQNLKDEKEYIEDVEAGTGANLSGKVRHGKKRKRKEGESSESASVRERLSAKLFNKNTMKRVYETLESVRKARAARNFEHQFNYALKKN
ncbi:unnamed protein product [Thelazia callipaeda]|uniref:UV-stimulated scaffold protein A n=1 Tax=Thelazia callipaeda TaxID=103827 RepID=A0A0N5CR85_THECL|nr:unnamed protein product [Thelazia callipaeda]